MVQIYNPNYNIYNVLQGKLMAYFSILPDLSRFYVTAERVGKYSHATQNYFNSINLPLNKSYAYPQLLHLKISTEIF